MIKRIWLKNYGPFREAELELGALTVLVGPNASGKSTAIEALYRIEKETWENVLAQMKTKGSRTEDIEVGLETQNQQQVTWTASFNNVEKVYEPKRESITPMPGAVLLRLQPEELRRPSYIAAEEPRMNEHGYGLPTVLASMKLADSESFAAIEEQTRAIVPVFERLRFKRSQIQHADGRSIIGDQLMFDMQGARDLPSTSVSDGTLFTLGLLTIMMEYATRNGDFQGSVLVLIDELERELHPRALGELVKRLRQLAEDSGIQILATSHSPYLLDSLEPGEVRLTGFLEDGSATIRNLTDHPDFERWKEEMKPGEFWSMAGEDWIR